MYYIDFIDDKVYNALTEGDIEKVMNALERGVSPNATYDYRRERTPLLSIAAEVYVYLFISISIMLINLFCILCTFRMII